MINEAIRIKRLAGIISESEYEKILIFEQQTNAVDVLLSKVQQSGLDLNDKNVQSDVIDSLLDVSFNPEKVDVNSIKEGSRESLEEEGGVIQTTVHVLEDIETIKKIAHFLGVDVKYVEMAKKFIDGVVKLLGWPFKKIQDLFYSLARLVGFDIEKSRIAGVGGLLLLGIAGIVYTIMSFPATIALITGGFAFKAALKFLYTMFKSWTGIKGFVSNIFSTKKEVDDVDYTIADFFNDIKKTSSKSLDVPFEWIYQFESWVNHMEEETKSSVMKKLMDLADFIKRGKSSGGHMNQVYRIAKRDGNTDVVNILKTLNNTFNPHNQMA